eukprot:TRINITY_DN16474_c0_g1_i4.p1 TRINITY_DN16474_c0_g1~~TRINITY_DN16474_c0_g1_i4.p1  ORF type:complete len:150 (+),score=45.87 TRINITY_DN16474_c0_g1_i4:176-625(+)
MAISSSNTGGAWDNAKKYIEKGGLKDKNKGKGSPQHAAAVIGDTVGDPLKDTSGPALNILIKLMAIISVVFSPVFMGRLGGIVLNPVSYTHLRAHETPEHLVCRLLLEKKKKKKKNSAVTLSFIKIKQHKKKRKRELHGMVIYKKKNKI